MDVKRSRFFLLLEGEGKLFKSDLKKLVPKGGPPSAVLLFRTVAKLFICQSQYTLLRSH